MDTTANPPTNIITAAVIEIKPTDHYPKETTAIIPTASYTQTTTHTKPATSSPSESTSTIETAIITVTPTNNGTPKLEEPIDLSNAINIKAVNEITLENMDCSGRCTPAWSIDGKLVAIASGKMISILDADTLVIVKEIELKVDPEFPYEIVTDLGYSPDGSRLAIGTNNGIYLYTLQNEAIEKINGAGVYSLEYSHNAKYIALGARERILIIDAITGKDIATLINGQAYQDLAFTQDDSILATTATVGKLVFWNTRTWSKYKSIEDSGSIYYSPNNQWILVGNRVYNAINFKMVSMFGEKEQGFTSQAIGINSDIAFLTDDASVYIWNLAENQLLLVLAKHNERISNISLNPSGTRLISIAADKRIIIWSVQ